MIDLYDSEVAALGKVWAEAVEHYEGRTVGDDTRNGFTRMVVEKCAAIGLKVEVDWYYTNVEGVHIPEISVIDRINQEFDHERQSHEVQSDLLGISVPGSIDEHGNLKSPKKSFGYE